MAGGGGTMPTTAQTPSPMPLPTSSPPVQPVIQTFDRDDDEDIAEDAPMPAQPLFPVHRPRAASEPSVQAAVQAPAEVVSVPAAVAPPVEVIHLSTPKLRCLSARFESRPASDSNR